MTHDNGTLTFSVRTNLFSTVLRHKIGIIHIQNCTIFFADDNMVRVMQHGGNSKGTTSIITIRVYFSYCLHKFCLCSWCRKMQFQC